MNSGLVIATYENERASLSEKMRETFRNHSLTDSDKTQAEKFKQAASELGCDEDESHFEDALKKVARHKPPPDAPRVPKEPKTKKPGR